VATVRRLERRCVAAVRRLERWWGRRVGGGAPSPGGATGSGFDPSMVQTGVQLVQDAVKIGKEIEKGDRHEREHEHERR
jgi:hypothetical protein